MRLTYERIHYSHITHLDQCEAQSRCRYITNTPIGQSTSKKQPLSTNLIHILAKHATPMNARRTTLGLVPAKLNTRVINTRSLLVLLSAAATVNPPISSMIVGENMTENIHLSIEINVLV